MTDRMKEVRKPKDITFFSKDADKKNIFQSPQSPLLLILKLSFYSTICSVICFFKI